MQHEPEMSVVEEGVKLAKDYVWRQFWKMKWITAIVVGALSTYTIQNMQWVPFLGFDFFTFTIVTIGVAFVRIQMNKLFITYAKCTREGKEVPKDVTSHIFQNTWVIILMTWMLMYWIVVILFATTLPGTNT